MALHRAAGLVMVPLAVLVVLGEDVVWPRIRQAGRWIAAWPPLLPLRRRMARLPAVLALPLFLVPELCSRGGTLVSAWLLLQGDGWRALAVYVAAKLLAGGTALWIYTACEPALLQIRVFAAMHDAVAAARRTFAARLAAPTHPGRFAARLQRVRQMRLAWAAASVRRRVSPPR